MQRLSKLSYSNQAHQFFYPDCSVEEISLKKVADELTSLILVIISNNKTYHLITTGPSTLELLGALFKTWYVKIYDLNEIDGFHYDFGRFVIEFNDDDDQYPYAITVNQLEISESTLASSNLLSDQKC